MRLESGGNPLTTEPNAPKLGAQPFAKTESHIQRLKKVTCKYVPNQGSVFVNLGQGHTPAGGVHRNSPKPALSIIRQSSAQVTSTKDTVRRDPEPPMEFGVRLSMLWRICVHVCARVCVCVRRGCQGLRGRRGWRRDRPRRAQIAREPSRPAQSNATPTWRGNATRPAQVVRPEGSGRAGSPSESSAERQRGPAWPPQRGPSALGNA